MPIYLKTKPKYGNKKIVMGGETFDSKGEWQRWLFLQEAARSGQIRDLRRQVKYTLVPTQYKTVEVQLKTKTKTERRVAARAVTYSADFVYKKLQSREPFQQEILGKKSYIEHWVTVVEDFKGMPNDRWAIKKALMLYVHGIDVREVRKATEPI